MRLSLQGAKRQAGGSRVLLAKESYVAGRVMLTSREDRLLRTLLPWPEMMEAWIDAMTMGIQERDLKTCKNGEWRCEKSYDAQVSNMVD